MPQPGPDRPATKESDLLNFIDYVQPIKRTIEEATRTNRLPLTIGIFGRWGSGKSSLMRMLEDELGPTPEERAQISLTRKEAKLTLTWSWPVIAVWFTLLSLGLYFGPLITSWLNSHIGVKLGISLLGWFATCFLVLGTLGRTSFELWLHGHIEQDLDSRRAIWLILSPLFVLALGLAIVILGIWLLRLETDVRLSSGVATVVYVTSLVIGAVSPSIILSVVSKLKAQINAILFRQQAKEDNLMKKMISGEKAIQAKISRGEKITTKDIESALKGTLSQDQAGNYQVIWFNAWKFTNEKELWAALLQEVLRQIRIQADGLERMRIKWQLWKRSIDWNSSAQDVLVKIFPTVGKAVLTAALAYFGGRLADTAVTSRFGVELGQAAGTAGGFLVGLLGVSNWLRTNVVQPIAGIEFNNYRKKTSYKNYLTFLSEFSEEFKQVMYIARGTGNPIVLMLDDLDRCLPEQAVSIMEAIKLFISDDAPVVFLIGADREFVERAIEVKYEKLLIKDDTNTSRAERFSQLGREYMEKIVQLSFNLPPIRDTEIDKFIDKTFKDNTWVTQNSHIFAAGLLPNPRQVIRTINLYNFVIELAQQKGLLYKERILLDILAKVVVVQYRWPELFADLIGNPQLLGAIESQYSSKSEELDSGTKVLVGKHKNKHGLQELLTVENSASLINLDLSEYVFLTGRAQTQGKSAEEIIEETAAEPLESKATDQRESAEPVESVKRAHEIKEVVSGSKVEFSKEEAGRLRQEIDRWREEIEELKQNQADSALLNSLDQSMEEAQELFEKKDLPAVGRILTVLKSTAERAQKEVDARDVTKEHRIKAHLSSDGGLVFRQAASYQPIEVLLEGFERGKPGEIIGYSQQGEHRKQFDELRGSNIASNVLRGKSTPVAMRELGEILGNYLDHVLSPLDRSSSIQYRIRITAMNNVHDALPWELATLNTISSEPLGLNPRYSLVRGSITASPRRLRSLEGFQPKLLVIYPPKDDQLEGRINAFKRLKFPFSVRNLEIENQDDSYAVITNERPLLVHMLGYLDRLGSSSSGLSGGSDGLKPRFEFQGLKIKFNSRDVGLLSLDTVDGIRVAERVASAGVSIQAWNTGYSPEAAQAFYNSFYPALLRSGQPEFAITEGRRAIAATFGQESYLAVSPVLYMGGNESNAV